MSFSYLCTSTKLQKIKLYETLTTTCLRLKRLYLSTLKNLTLPKEGRPLDQLKKKQQNFFKYMYISVCHILLNLHLVESITSTCQHFHTT